MSALSMKERLRQQKEQVGATGAVTDDALPVNPLNPRVVDSREEERPATATRPTAIVASKSRTQGIPISAADDGLLAEMEAYCRSLGIKLRRTSNISLLTRSAWRVLYEIMRRDPTAFEEAIEVGRRSQ
jgi:hypothetical protein